MSATRGPIHVRVNDEAREVPPDQTLTGLIVALELPPQGMLVEYNGRALLRSEWEQVALAEGDRLEILRVVAGG